MPDFTVRVTVRMQAENLAEVPLEALGKAVLNVPGVAEVNIGAPRERSVGGRPRDERKVAESFLRWWLGKHGTTRSAAVYEAAEQRGIKRRTLRRAADTIGIVRDPRGGPNTTWSLPPEDTP